MYFTISNAHKRSAIRIKASYEYDYVDAFRNPFLLQNMEFKIYEGKKLFDIVGFREVWNFAVSKKVKALLEENNITGWGCYPIKIENIEEEYFRFYLTGKPVRCTNENKDGLVPMFEPILFDESEWDKSDIFNISGTGVIACLSSVKALFEKNKITNIEFDPL